MGYEVTRFTHEIDEELHCSICAMVLKDPVQSPCEHLFCNDCIRGWLAVGKSCPVERGPVKLEDIKPASRAVRNLVNKFEIKCDFESKGCAEILKLEKLDDHVGRCEHNPNAKVICDKGCNIEMRRHAYEAKNCFRHLADQAVRQQETILKLNDQLSLQNEKIEKLSEEVTSLRRQQDDYDDKVAMINDEVNRKSEAIEALNEELNRRRVEIERLNEDLNRIRRREDEFVKLNEEICGLRRQIEQRENEIVAHSDEISKLGSETSDESEVLVDEQPEFRVVRGNGKISIDQNVLDDNNGCGYVQSVNPLEPTKFSFKFEILSLGNFIEIGLAPMCPCGWPQFTARYNTNGWSNFDNGKSFNFGAAWKVGDIIECGINFPSDFVNDGRDVRVYINRNGKLMGEGLVAMPVDGLFPTVGMRGGPKSNETFVFSISFHSKPENVPHISP